MSLTRGLALASLCIVGNAAAGGQSYVDYAKVLEVEPISEAVAVPVKKERCDRSRQAVHLEEAIAGAVAAERFGGSIADAISEEIRLRRRTEQLRRCRLVTTYESRDQIVAYRVRYAYGGDVFERRMHEHPGERIQVRVNLKPR